MSAAESESGFAQTTQAAVQGGTPEEARKAKKKLPFPKLGSFQFTRDHDQQVPDLTSSSTHAMHSHGGMRSRFTMLL